MTPAHVLQFCPLDSSEKQEGSSDPRACSTVLPPLQRSKEAAVTPENVSQFCPLDSSEKQEGSSDPRECSTVLPRLQRSKKAAVAPWSNVLCKNSGGATIMEELLKTTFIETAVLTM